MYDFEFQPVSELQAPLGRREMHLWSIRLDPPTEEVESLRALLGDEELERAGRFRFERHRRRFIVRRGRLRQLLGSYRSIAPEQIELSYGERGKPALTPRQNSATEPLQFNLSDSEDLAVYAFSFGFEMGVDVEVLRPIPDALNIARSFFAAEEREVLSSVPASGVPEAFFNCWTRKEAYIKAIGEGLSEPLDRFCVTLAPREPARFLHIGGSPREAEAWSLLHFEPATGAVGALAFRDHDWRISCRTLVSPESSDA